MSMAVYLIIFTFNFTFFNFFVIILPAMTNNGLGN